MLSSIFPMKPSDKQQIQRIIREKSSEPFEFELRSKIDKKETNHGDNFYNF